MTNTITVDQLKELLQIQKEFDDRIPTLNIEDSKIAYIVEFFEWFNTLEIFKNWKAKPGKALDVQLDELSDLLAFGLSIANQKQIDIDKLIKEIPGIKNVKLTYNKDFVYDFMHDVSSFGVEANEAVIIPLAIANDLYSIDQLIAAYKKKMKRNHDRQNGTADKDKGYV